MPSAVTSNLFPHTSPQNPVATALAPDGDLWFAGGKPEVIGYLEANGQVTEFAVPLEISGPAPALAVGSDGNLWVTLGAGQNLIGRIDDQGHLSTFAIPSGLPVQHIAFAPDGNLWFLEAGGAGWINPSNGVVMEFRNFGVDFSQFSFAANGSLLLSHGPNATPLGHSAFVAMFASGGFGGSLTVPSAVLEESLSNGIIALPTGFAVGPTFVANLPRLSSAAVPPNIGSQGVPQSGGPTPPPGSASEQIVWMSMADHGVRGAYYSRVQRNDSPNRPSGPNEDRIGNVPLSAPPTSVGKSSLAGSGTIALADDADPDVTAAALARQREKVRAVAQAIVDACVSGGYLTFRVTATISEDLWLFSGQPTAQSAMPVANRSLIFSRREANRVDDQADEASSDPLLPTVPVDYAENVPEKSALLAIAREYRRQAEPVAPERKEPASKSRLLTRVAAAWLIAQSIYFGVGRKARGSSL